MNTVFFAIVLVAFLVGGDRQLTWVPASPDDVAPMAALTTGMVEAAGGAVTLAGTDPAPDHVHALYTTV